MGLDKRHNNTGGGASQTQPNFNRFDDDAIAGQAIFQLSFILTTSDVVFINGAPIPKTEYSGFGTTTITLSTPLNLYDKILIIG